MREWAHPTVHGVGSVVLLSRGDVRRKGLVSMVATLAYGAVLWLFGLSTLFAISIVIGALLGFFDSIGETLRFAFMQLFSPDELLGRVMSVAQIVLQGGPSSGYLVAGVLASAVGAPGALLVGGAVIVFGTSLLTWRVPAAWRSG